MAQRVDELSAEIQFSRLQSSDESEAAAAFHALCDFSRQRLKSTLKKYGATSEEVEDILQEVWARVWHARKGTSFSSTPRWFAFLRRLGINALVDLRKIPVTLLSAEEITAIPESDLHSVVTVVMSSLDHERILSCTEEIWLGAPQTANRHLRLIAAQMFFVDNLSVTEVLGTLNAGRMPNDKIRREELDEWLSSPWAVLGVSHSELYFPTQKLAADILDVSPVDVNRIVSEAANDENLSKSLIDSRTIAVLSKYYNIRVETRAMSDEEAEEVLREHLPFSQTAHRTHQRFCRKPDCLRWLQEHGLWRKLVFDYWFLDEISQKEILCRTSPAAEVFHYKSLSPTTVNALTSGRRLLNQLTKALSQSNGR